MEYAHNAFGLEGVTGLGAQTFMRGSPFLDAAWYGDLDYIRNAVEEHILCRGKYWREPSQFATLNQRPFTTYSPDGGHV